MTKKDHFKYPEKLAKAMLAALKADMEKIKKNPLAEPMQAIIDNPAFDKMKDIPTTKSHK
jgi:hypothetical protein